MSAGRDKKSRLQWRNYDTNKISTFLTNDIFSITKTFSTLSLINVSIYVTVINQPNDLGSCQ